MSVLSCYYTDLVLACVIHVQTPRFKKVLFLSVCESLQKKEREEWKGLGEQEKFHQFVQPSSFLCEVQHSYVDEHRLQLLLSQQQKARVRGPPTGNSLMMKCWPGIRFVPCDILSNYGKCKKKQIQRQEKKLVFLLPLWLYTEWSWGVAWVSMLNYTYTLYKKIKKT